MRKKFLRLVLGAGIVLVGAGIVRVALQAAPKVTVSLSASPATFSGYCPVQVQFQIGFKVSEPCSINYNFIDAAGHKTDASTLACKSAGTFYALKTRSLSGGYSGWVAVQVTSPVAVQSNQVTLKIKCLPKPIITSAKLDYSSGPSPEMDIGGTDFGAAQGTKNIKIDGTLISAKPGWGVIHWSATGITMKTSGVVPWEHTYKIAVAEGSQTVSNIYMAKFNYQIDQVAPTSGHPSELISIYIWSLPSPQGEYKLDMWRQNLGYFDIPIVTWGTPIKAKVPYSQYMPLGSMPLNIRLKKGTAVVSNLVPFTIIIP